MVVGRDCAGPEDKRKATMKVRREALELAFRIVLSCLAT
jgi:hypothetical protein